MENWVKASWVVLAVVHAAPAAVIFLPGLVERLYGVPADGTVGLLLVHRGGLFLAVVAVALLAAFSPAARPAATLVVGISMITFLVLYAGQGLPAGPLRTIALVDAAALLPLAIVGGAAWRS